MLLDQDPRNDGSTDASVVGGRRASVTKKQAENHMVSRAIVSRQRKARMGIVRPEQVLYKRPQQHRSPTPHGCLVSQPWEQLGPTIALFGHGRDITSAGGELGHCPDLEGNCGSPFSPISSMDSAAALKLEIARLSGKSTRCGFKKVGLNETG